MNCFRGEALCYLILGSKLHAIGSGLPVKLLNGLNPSKLRSGLEFARPRGSGGICQNGRAVGRVPGWAGQSGRGGGGGGGGRERGAGGWGGGGGTPDGGE